MNTGNALENETFTSFLSLIQVNSLFFLVVERPKLKTGSGHEFSKKNVC